MKEEEIGSLSSTVASDDNIDINSNNNNKNKNNSVGYSKTKLLGLFSLFDIDDFFIVNILRIFLNRLKMFYDSKIRKKLLLIFLLL
jgi:hypothetical protein